MSDDRAAPTPDQAAAHDFLSELRTRITTQPLPYQYGVEARALESLWEVFGQARAAMKNHPGCAAFAQRTTEMLNLDLRPMTAKWHRAYEEGQLNSRDGANEFREDLEAVQVKLRTFAGELHRMAYGTAGSDALTPAALADAELERCLKDLPYGIARTGLIPDAMVDAINAKEAAAVAARRKRCKAKAKPEPEADSGPKPEPQSEPEPAATNAVGLGLSGGGIRSATFCLGVTQVLAERNLLKDVDFLSTVSGGGFVGCFLTTRLGRGEPHADIAGPRGPDPAAIRYVRQHAKYLSASNLKERWSMVTASLAGMILNWTAPLFVIALAALVALSLPSLRWDLLLLTSGAATLASLLVYAFGMRYARSSGGTLLAIIASVTLVIAALWLLMRTYDFIAEHIGITAGWGLTGVIAAGITAFPTIVRFIPFLGKPHVRRIALRAMLILAGLIVPLGGIALAFWFYHLGRQPLDPAASAANPLHYADGRTVLAIVTALLGLIALLLLDINATSPHRLYRNLLARTFVQRSEDDVAPVPLAAINPENAAPYHLINATVNLPSSNSSALRERKSDFFLFSKYWCGAPSIGYVETDAWSAGRAPLDLATAMAVSGAAASPYMGLGSFPTLSALLAFLNVRLGYWILRPKNTRLFKAPGFACLLREMTGVAMSEKQSWINLSDGGHIENMAIYELLRRRCKFIISIDGEADPQSTFAGHLTLVRHAQIDFGVRIEPDLTALRPDIKSKFSQTHAMLSRVHYPAAGGLPAGEGLILYMKLSVTGNELEMIKRYRLLHPDFPHQTTLDQFFDEEQFEAYRQLGVHVAEGLFARALLHGLEPATVRGWFAALARNLLLPER